MSDVVQNSGPILPQSSGRARKLPRRMSIVQGTSSNAIRKGGKPGMLFIETDPDQPVISVDSMRLVLIDGDIPGRVMFAYDGAGKPVMGEQNKEPWCGSSDGDHPRSSFKGKQYVDWRNGAIVTIGEGFADPRTKQFAYFNESNGYPNGMPCDKCPLGNWHSIKDSEGNKVLNEKGSAKTGKPPCSESPTFVFWDLDREMPLIMQATSFGARNALIGNKTIKGLSWYYGQPVAELPDGTWSTPTYNGKHHFALIMKVAYQQNDFGGAFVPVLSVDPEPFTDYEEAIIYGTGESPSVFDMYLAPDLDGWNTRQYLTGEAYAGREEDDLFGSAPNAVLLTEGETADSPPIDTEMYKRLMGQGGTDRRAVNNTATEEGEPEPF